MQLELYGPRISQQRGLGPKQRQTQNPQTLLLASEPGRMALVRAWWINHLAVRLRTYGCATNAASLDLVKRSNTHGESPVQRASTAIMQSLALTLHQLSWMLIPPVGSLCVGSYLERIHTHRLGK